MAGELWWNQKVLITITFLVDNCRGEKCMHNTDFSIYAVLLFLFKTFNWRTVCVNKVVINNLLDSRSNNVRYTMRKKGAQLDWHTNIVCAVSELTNIIILRSVVSFDRTMAQLGQKFRFVQFFSSSTIYMLNRLHVVSIE